MEQLDRVIRRAVELQLEDDLGFEQLDEATVTRVAAEIGIDPAHVKRAIAETRAVPQPESDGIWDRVLVPVAMSESRTVNSAPREVEDAVVEWMRRQQGMRMRRRVPDGAVWEKDSHLITAVRMGLGMGRGDRALRSAREVTHRVQPASDADQVVSLEADASNARAIGLGLLGAGVVAAGVGTGLAAATGDGLQAVEAVAAGLGLATYSSAVVAGVKLWGRRIRDALGRALDGITHPELGRDTPTGFERLRHELGSWRRHRPL